MLVISFAVILGLSIGTYVADIREVTFKKIIFFFVFA